MVTVMLTKSWQFRRLPRHSRHCCNANYAVFICYCYKFVCVSAVTRSNTLYLDVNHRLISRCCDEPLYETSGARSHRLLHKSKYDAISVSKSIKQDGYSKANKKPNSASINHSLVLFRSFFLITFATQT